MHRVIEEVILIIYRKNKLKIKIMNKKSKNLHKLNLNFNKH